MWHFLAFVVAVGLIALRWKSFVGQKKELYLGRAVTTFVTYLAIGWTLATIPSTIWIIDAGQRGVVFDKIKGVKSVALTEGINFVIPYIQEVTVMEVRVQRAEYGASAASKDLQDVTTKLQLNLYPDPLQISTLFQKVGPAYMERIVHPAVQEVLKACTARYTAEELVTKREQVKTAMQDMLFTILRKNHIVLVDVYITDFDFSKGFTEAIEQKQVAQQEALKAKQVLDRVRIEAEQTIAKARAEAESIRMQQSVITPLMIQLRTLEMMKDKWDGAMPQVIIGGSGGIPLLNLDGLVKRTPRQAQTKEE